MADLFVGKYRIDEDDGKYYFDAEYKNEERLDDTNQDCKNIWLCRQQDLVNQVNTWGNTWEENNLARLEIIPQGETFELKGEIFTNEKEQKRCFYLNNRGTSIMVPFNTILTNMDEGVGYQCPTSLLQQFLCAYGTNQIIVLHGKPGTGKTSFVEAFVKAMNAFRGMGQYVEKLISVRPNWVDGQDLMGYYNPIEHRYYTTPFLEALMEANAEQERNPVNPKKYIICLDEMNLAHIEYYFADILSAMETEEKEITLISKDEWVSAMELFEKIKEYYEAHDPATIDDMMRYSDAKKGQANLEKLENGKLKIPANVQFVGTLNMDATTKGLSPKVIDRSFIIEVSGETEEALPDLEEANDAADADGNRRELKDRVKELIAGDNEHTAEDLKKAGVLQLSRRVEDQISKMRERADVFGIEDARFWDYVISGKVLPKVHIELSDNSELNTAADNQYPVSAKQLKDKYDPDGKILSYWLTR